MRRQIFGLNTTKKHLLYWGPPFPFLVKVPRKITTFIRLYVNCSMDFIITISQKYYVIKFEIENFKIFLIQDIKKRKNTCQCQMSKGKVQMSNVFGQIRSPCEISVDLLRSQ